MRVVFQKEISEFKIFFGDLPVEPIYPVMLKGRERSKRGYAKPYPPDREDYRLKKYAIGAPTYSSPLKNRIFFTYQGHIFIIEDTNLI